MAQYSACTPEDIVSLRCVKALINEVEFDIETVTELSHDAWKASDRRIVLACRRLRIKLRAQLRVLEELRLALEIRTICHNEMVWFISTH